MTHLKRKLKFLLALTIIINASFVQAGELNIDWDKIFNNEVIVEPVESSNGLPGVRAIFGVAASREKIWGALLDYDHWTEMFDGIIKLKVLEEDENGANVEFWADAVIKNLHYVLYRRYEDPGHKVTWKRVSGDMKRIEGSWLIVNSPQPETKVLIYESYVKPSGLVGLIPTKLIRWGALGKTRSMAIKLRNWIEENEELGNEGDQRR